MPVTALLPALSLLAALAPPYQIDSVRFRFTQYDQRGVGYQSAAGPVGQAGSEWEMVEQPQAEVVAHVGERVTERLWIPIDVITAASPDHSVYGLPVGSDPPDAVTTASRNNTAGTFDTLTSYRWDHDTELSFHAAFHIEEPFESWSYGLGAARSFAEDNTVVGVSVNQIVDWFDRFNLDGKRNGRVNRSTTNVNATVSQVLSPYTIAVLSYGGTLQVGTLGNTWSSVLMSDGSRGEERLPRERLRNALSLRVAEWLPWNGALKLSYRAYLDDWSAYAHTLEANLIQRLFGGLHLRAEYRVHWQTAVRFYTEAADPLAIGYRTADSDLAHFVAQTIGGTISWDLGLAGRVRDLHVDLGYQRYFRSNNLTVDIATCGFGLIF